MSKEVDPQAQLDEAEVPESHRQFRTRRLILFFVAATLVVIGLKIYTG